MLDYRVGVVRLVNHQDDGTIGLLGQREVQVGVAATGVVGTAKPDARARTFDGNCPVDQHGNFEGIERAGDERGGDRDIVIAEDGVCLRGFEGAENLGAAVGRMGVGNKGERSAGDEVAGYEDEIGLERIDAVDDVLEEEGFGELIEMDVGKLNDAETMKGRRQVGDVNRGVDLLDSVAGNHAGVECKASRRDAGTNDKRASS